jgi:hypothetical protein
MGKIRERREIEGKGEGGNGRDGRKKKGPKKWQGWDVPYYLHEALRRSDDPKYGLAVRDTIHI